MSKVLSIDVGAYTGASAAISGGRAYFGTFENEVIAVDLKAKRVVWRYEHPTLKFPYNSSVALSGTRVIVGGRDKLIHGIDAATGAAVWTLPTKARVESSPAIVGNRAIVGSNDGRLYIADVASGKELWQFNAGGGVATSPAVASGRIVIGTLDGQVICLG